MTSTHKTYETEFKLEVARMVVAQGLSVQEVMTSTGVGKTAIRRWAELSCGAQWSVWRGQTADG